MCSAAVWIGSRILILFVAQNEHWFHPEFRSNPTYGIAVKIITDIASETVKKIMGL
jgi:hypothetical protein